ncbi:MAG: transposase [Candidatus Solibacter usitatus]|nr:transposase [Candidatus Solibacter usitatus]
MHVTKRHLPHIYEVGCPLFVTFRLYGSLPKGRYFDRNSVTSGQAFDCLDRLLDRETCGPLHLKMPGIAQLVSQAIQQGEPEDYCLHAWVVMPNHVHLLITPRRDVSQLLQRLKGATARQANQQLHREGDPFWQRESYDRMVRDAEEFRRIENYIVRNPVRAGLAASTECYQWSNAWNPAAVR